jgi:hypothetical protein
MLGERLRERLEELIAAYVARMRNDSRIPGARELPQALLEDHALSFLSDLFQSIVVVERSGEIKDLEETLLLKDGSHIQTLIADLHGRQRYRMGWTDEALHREYEILDEEVAAFVQRVGSNGSVDPAVNWVLDYLKQLLKRAHESSFAAFGAAAREPERHASTEKSLR